MAGSSGGRSASVYSDRYFVGLYTNRNPLRSPLSVFYSEGWHLGGTDALIGGLNTEISNRLTIIRRPGNPAFSTATIPLAPNWIGYFHEANSTEANLAPNSSTVIRILVDTATNLYIITPTSLQSIFTKSANAGQTDPVGVGQTLYFGNGVDTRKWNDFGAGAIGNNNGNTVNPTWLLGIVAPTAAPTVTPQSSGAGAVTWTASVFYSTMGLIVDSNNNIQQLTSVNADPTNVNSTQIGTSGSGQPAWSNVAGGTTVDGTVTWTDMATPLAFWQASHLYQPNSVIYDPDTNAVFYSSHSYAVTSGTSKPKFATSALNVATDDNQVRWRYLGLPALWQPSHAYSGLFQGGNGVPAGSFIVEPIQPTAAAITNGQTIYIQIVTATGTSSTYSHPNWPTLAGSSVQDGQLAWLTLGPKAWSSGTGYFAWSSLGQNFGVVVDPIGNFQVCVVTGTSGNTIPFNPWQASHVYALNAQIVDSNGNLQKVTTSGTSGSSAPTWNKTNGGTTTDNGVTWTNQGASTIHAWGSNYGDQTIDGTVTWVCVGASANSAWKASSKYYLPASGFFPPQGSASFGSAAVKDNNATPDTEFVISSGFSGNTQPTWATTKGSTTTDNAGGGTDVGVTWINNGPPTTLSFTYQFGYGYVYSFKARVPKDPFSVGTPNPVGLPGVTNISGTFLPAPFGSGDGSVSTASPVGNFVGSNNAGAQILITGAGSIDPQVDTIEVFRTTDGGATYFHLTDLVNPAPQQNGTPGIWTLIDATPDLQLTTVLLAPLAHINDPPPAGITNLVQHLGRLWGSVGNVVFASAGPIIGNPNQPPGNGNTAWPPLQFWNFTNTVVRLVPTPSGLIVFTTGDIEMIVGGPQMFPINTFYPIVIVPDIGIPTHNALTVHGGVIYAYTSDSNVISLDPSTGISYIGDPIADQLKQFNPATVYLTFLASGIDRALYVSDGTLGWFRCTPQLAPDSSVTGPVWSPKANIIGGCKAIASVEVSPGQHRLLIGSSIAGQPILARDSNYITFTDNGTAYEANAIIGSIVLAQPGQLAEVSFITCDFVKTGTSPLLSVLPNEISGTFESLSTYTVLTGLPPQDPPSLYGATLTPSSLFSNRYFMSQTIGANGTPLPAWLKHLQLLVDFQTDTVMNEILSLTLYGNHWQESDV